MKGLNRFNLQTTFNIRKDRIPYVLFFALLFFPYCVTGTFYFTMPAVSQVAVYLRYLFCFFMAFFSFRYVIRKDQMILWMPAGLLLVLFFVMNRRYGVDMSAFVNYGLRAVFFMCYFITAVHVHTEEMFSAVWWVCSLLTVINILSLILCPEGLYMRYDLNASGEGVAYWFLGNRNLYVDYLYPMVFCSLILQYLTNGSYRKFYISMFLSVLTVILSGSATTILVISIIALYFLLIRKGRLTKLANPVLLSSVYAAISVVIVFLGKVEAFSVLIVKILKKDLTLSSRTVIWNNVMNHIVKQPILGYGFRSGEDFIENSLTMHAHNLFLHITYSGGIVALAILLFLMVMCVVRIIKAKKHQSAYLLFSLLWFAYLWMEFSEPRIYFPFLFAVIAVICNVKKLIERREAVSDKT